MTGNPIRSNYCHAYNPWMARARYKGVLDALAADIRAGKIPPGTRLPTHRELAAREGLALVTATRVYAELANMGLVSGETGRGTFVRESSLSPRHDVDLRAFTDGVVDLNFNYPSLPGQTELLRNALRALASSGDLQALLRYQSHGGRPHERASVALHLEQRGLSVPADQVLIVSGAQHGLAVAALAMLQPGDAVAVDALTYPGLKVLAQTQRLELVPLPAGADGPDLDALAQLCRTRRIRAIYAIPTMHNPLGWVISMASRQRLVAIAREHGLLIIEDAAYAYLAEKPPPPRALQERGHRPSLRIHRYTNKIRRSAGARDPRNDLEHTGDDDRDRHRMAQRRHRRSARGGEARRRASPAGRRPRGTRRPRACRTSVVVLSVATTAWRGSSRPGGSGPDARDRLGVHRRTVCDNQ